jgi:aminomethyltransferase
MSAALLQTPLHDLHLALGARMVPFAGHELPLSYPAGILAEHRQCRASAALFDVSHMGQIRVAGDGAAAALEALVPADILGLAPGQQRYTYFTDVAGGILDDLIVCRRQPASGAGDLLLVVNAARRQADLQHLLTHLGAGAHVQPLAGQALLALQGPKAASALARLNPGVAALRFMGGGWFTLASDAGGLRTGVECYVTRSGYTGEDGFEISLPAAAATALARALLAQPEVLPAGLGARDTLRLEAGLCLYGHDIDTRTTPIEAGLAWAIPKLRRPGGERAGGYPGAEVIDAQFAHGAPMKRVGLSGVERAPVREGTELHDARGHVLGRVTSGTVSPTLGTPIAMGYLQSDRAQAHAEVFADVRGRRLPLRVTPLPFVPQRYHRD